MTFSNLLKSFYHQIDWVSWKTDLTVGLDYCCHLWYKVQLVVTRRIPQKSVLEPIPIQVFITHIDDGMEDSHPKYIWRWHQMKSAQVSILEGSSKESGQAEEIE